MAEKGIDINLPEDKETDPLIPDTDDHEEIEMNPMGSTSTSWFDPYGGHARQKETSFGGEGSPHISRLGTRV